MPFETIEFEPNECPFDSDSSAEELNFDTNTDTEDGVGIAEEWDRLPDISINPLYQHPRDHSISPSFNDNSHHRERTTSLSSSASGLVTSAAASVASALWPWKR